jgi:hypothetical protein
MRKICDVFVPTLYRHEVSRTSYDTKNFTQIVWVNKTITTRWTYRIYAIDNGNPRRGDFIPVNVTISATCTSHANFVINNITGEVFLRAPSLTGSKYRKYILYNIYRLFTTILL